MVGYLRICVGVDSRFHGQFFFEKEGLSQKNMLVKFNSVATFHCQISVAKVSELSNKSNLCCVLTQTHYQSFCDK